MSSSVFKLGVGMDSNLFLILVLGLQEVTGSRYSLSLLFLHAHSLALALAFTATLFNSLYPCGPFGLMALLPGVGGNTRVRIQDGQV